MAIDLNALREAVRLGLPRNARWLVDREPLDFDFSPDRYNFRRIDNADVIGGVSAEWGGFLVFGRYNFSEGGGASPFVAVRERDGRVCGLDIERQGESIFTFNSSLDRFIRTFALLDEYLRAGKDPPSGVILALKATDPEVFPASEWAALVDFVSRSKV